uniref:UDP glucuronosyltransferase 5 family, polypeptide D1 n=1 Tax=Maylandia zebra TaxID=106582 RepID=A0A3P9DAA5_9CICH
SCSWTFLLSFLVMTLSCDGGKVLVFPVDGSHWLNMKILVEAVHSQCHQITFLNSHCSHSVLCGILRSYGTMQYKGGTHVEVVAKFTSTIFENKTLIGDLNKTGYDLFLTDPTFPGGVLLAHHLQLPLVFNVRWLFSGEAHLAVAPSSVSYIPICFSHNSDKIDFFQRIRNMIHYIMVFYRDYYVSRQPYQALCDRYFGNNVSLMSLTQKADLWLMRVDFTFEVPRPTMPNVIYIGASKVSLQRPSKFVVFTSIYLLYLQTDWVFNKGR